VTSISAAEPEPSSLSLLEIGRRAAMEAERKAIERVLNETRWNRRQAAKILKVSYKALLNKMKMMEEQDSGKKKTCVAE
jgi:DNA-binding NtrC family response regulator